MTEEKDISSGDIAIPGSVISSRNKSTSVVSRLHQHALEEITQSIADTTNHFIEFAMNTEEHECLNVDDIMNVRSYKYSKEGTWDPTIIWFGARRTGKSVQLKDIVTTAHERGLIGRVTVITATRQNQFWDNVVPYTSVFPITSALSVIKDIKQKQQLRASLMQRGKPLLYGPESFQHTLILDDVVHDKHLARYSDELAEAFFTFRHTGCAVIMTSQYPTAIAPGLRSNADFVFIMTQNGYNAKELLWRDHLEFITDRRIANYFMDNVPKQWRSIVIHKTDTTLTPQEKVRWFRAIDRDEVEGEPDPITGIKKLTVQWGNEKWRKVKAKEDDDYKKKEAQSEEEAIRNGNRGGWDSFGDINTKAVIENELVSLRAALNKLM